MRLLLAVAVAWGVALPVFSADRLSEPVLVGVERIWDRAPHNGFTDLIRFGDRWYCTFREGAGHVSDDGILKVIASDDGAVWESVATFKSLRGFDMREAKFSITPDGRLMLVGCEANRKTDPPQHQSLVWFTSDGKNWTEQVPVADADFWLWRGNWHNGKAYFFGYGCRKDNRWLRLYTSSDGKKFETLIDKVAVEGTYPNETSLVFLPDDTCYCLLRQDGNPDSGCLGQSRPPYTQWSWKPLGVRIGGPNMIRLPDGRFVAVVRRYGENSRSARTVLDWLDPQKGTLTEAVELPSGGDTSYAGLVWHDGLLWISYYSSHEEKTAVYLAKVKFVSEPSGEAAGATGRSIDSLRGMLAINEDNSHFFGSREPEAMTLAGLQAFVDQYAGSAVTHLFLCPNAMRASFRSRSRDAIWDPVGGKEPQGAWPQNAKRLFEAGLDPYQVWIDRCREKGVSPWLSMRMNDVHSVDDDGNFMHSSFWRAHPEFRRVPNGSASPWVNRAMNYAHAEVRRHQMDFVRELLERYDPDGLELDWMRFGYHLTPGREREEAAILTEFVGEVRALTTDWSKKRGHSILLGVRVPAHPDAAAGLGMDAVRWASEGLVDLLVPCPFWTSSDFDIPVELWHQRLGAAARQVVVAPGLEYNARPWPGGQAAANDLASARGFAASAYQRGAQSLYLFNWMDSQTRPVAESAYGLLLREGLSPQGVHNSARRHPICFRDTVPPGFPNGVQLPADATVGKTFRIHIGAKPQSAEVWAVAGLARGDGLAEAGFEASLNGRALGAAENIDDLKTLGGGTARGVRFLCPPDAVQDGYNQLVVRQVTSGKAQQIVWVEMRVNPK